jgi:hypothetical protein
MYLRITDLSTMVSMIYPGLWSGRFNRGRQDRERISSMVTTLRPQAPTLPVSALERPRQDDFLIPNRAVY